MSNDWLNGAKTRKSRILKAVDRNYLELEEILKEAFLMYDDFKSEISNVYSKTHN
ncbi:MULTISPECIES: hypothetical protein [Bacillus cereus group]|uniref:hypothetical protein n=1 Tax=Bacillus cereus group TaxID=86661 RepID=UPI001F0A3942|nr:MULTISPECIES: hypothetical protein [Bacillus cereus group]MDH4421465.1 hypothetical protein [Bacillus cereus]